LDKAWVPARGGGPSKEISKNYSWLAFATIQAKRLTRKNGCFT
jgi:hypothetical protein